MKKLLGSKGVRWSRLGVMLLEWRVKWTSTSSIWNLGRVEVKTGTRKNKVDYFYYLFFKFKV